MMKRITSPILTGIVILFLTAGNAASQTFTISGGVWDDSGSEKVPMEDVTVYLNMDPSTSTVTGSDARSGVVRKQLKTNSSTIFQIPSLIIIP